MILLLACTDLAGAVEPPTQSVWTHTSSNGFGVLVFDDDRLTQGWNHVYQSLDATHVSADLLYDSYFGYTDLEGTGNWLVTPESVRTVDGTGIIESVERVGDLEFTQYAFMPMTHNAWGVVQVARVRNASTTAKTTAFELTSLHNWKPGGGEIATAQEHDLVVERGSTSLWYRAPGAIEDTCEEAYSTVIAGRRLAGSCSFYDSDNVPAFGWNIPALGPGEDRWVGVFTAQDASSGWVPLPDGPQAWLRAELEWWGQYHAEGSEPAGMNAAETAVFRQQIAFLTMSQVREAGSPYGQIPASLPVAAPDEEFPHTWNITWVRDASYALVALAQAGHTDEAASALRFLFQPGKAGLYASYLGGLDYGLSVCRLYGDGTEWSDDDGTGPNIELDNWGLYLWALDRTNTLAGDGALVAELGPRALDEIADPLVASIIPGTNLVRGDSSIWERHWWGHEEQFTYTSVMAVAGLRAAGNLATQLGDIRANGYLSTAAAIQTSIGANLVDADGVLAGSLGELNAGIGYLDIAAVEAYNFDVLDAQGETFAPTLAMWDAWLKVPSGLGFSRNDDGSAYDTQEWAFADLRLAPALRRACATARASELEDWITQQALANDRQIPELFDPAESTFEGPTPMLGFGAGLYVLAMQDRAALEGRCAPTVEPPFSTEIEATYEPGCGSSSAGAAGVLALGVVGWAVWGRRRR